MMKRAKWFSHAATWKVSRGPRGWVPKFRGIPFWGSLYYNEDRSILLPVLGYPYLEKLPGDCIKQSLWNMHYVTTPS